jgi:uncharacterized protein (DUF433 family)
MPEIAQFTAAEAAFVLREPVHTVKMAFDAGPVRAVLRRRAGVAVRTVGWSDLFYLFAVRSLRDELTPMARTAFYEALQHGPVERGQEVRFGHIRIAVADLVDEIERRTTNLSELAGKVAFRDDGEAILKDAGVEVCRIAALLDGGLTADEVMGDYPSLTRDQIETAKAYAEAYPTAGRPYPRLTVKRALRGAGLEALDAVMSDDAAPE